MRERARFLGLGATLVAVSVVSVGVALADESVEIVLRSGEVVRGKFLEMAGRRFRVDVDGTVRVIDEKDVQQVRFTGHARPAPASTPAPAPSPTAAPSTEPTPMPDPAPVVSATPAAPWRAKLEAQRLLGSTPWRMPSRANTEWQRRTQPLEYLPDGKSLVTVDGTGSVVVFDTATGVVRHRISFEGASAATPAADVCLFDPDRAAERLVPPPPKRGEPLGLRALVSYQESEVVRVFDLERGRLIGTCRIGIEGAQLRVRSDGTQLLAADTQGVRLLDLGAVLRGDAESVEFNRYPKLFKNVGQKFWKTLPDFTGVRGHDPREVFDFASDERYAVCGMSGLGILDLNAGRGAGAARGCFYFPSALSRDRRWFFGEGTSLFVAPVPAPGSPELGDYWSGEPEGAVRLAPPKLGGGPRVEPVVNAFGGFSWDSTRLVLGVTPSSTLEPLYESPVLYVWDVATGREVGHTAGSHFKADHVVFSPDGTTLASVGGQSSVVKLWDVATGRELTGERGHEDECTSVAWSPDGRRVVSASLDRTVRVWDPATGESRARLEVRSDDAAASAWDRRVAAFTRDGKDLYVGLTTVHANNEVHEVYQVDTAGKTLRTFAPAKHAILQLALSPDGRLLAGACDEEFRIWSVADGQSVRAIPLEKGPGSVAWTPDGHGLVVTSDAGVRVVDVLTGEAQRQLPWAGARRAVLTVLGPVTFDSEGHAVERPPQIIAGNARGELAAWDEAESFLLPPKPGEPLKEWSRAFEGHAGAIRALALSSDGKLLASAGDDGVVALHEVATARCLDRKRVGEWDDVANDLAFSPSSDRLLVATKRGLVVVLGVDQR